MDTTEKISLYKNTCGYLARHYEVLPEEPPMERSIIPENIGEECNGIVAPHTQCKSGNKKARTVGHSRAKQRIPRDIEFFRKFFAEEDKKSASAKTLYRIKEVYLIVNRYHPNASALCIHKSLALRYCSTISRPTP